MNRLLLKIISLFLSLGIWFYVNLGVNPLVTRRYKIPIFIKGETKLKEVRLSPNEVTVRIRGRRVALLNREKGGATAFVDSKFFNDKEGVAQLPVQVNLPAIFTRLDYFPKIVDVNITKLFRRDFFLGTHPHGEPKEGFLIDKINASNIDYVSVLGAKANLDQIEKVVAFVDISGKSQNFNASYPLVLLDKNEKKIDGKESGLKWTPTHANISVVFKEGFPRRILPVNLDIRDKLSTGLHLAQKIELKTANGTLLSRVEVEGPPSRWKDIKTIRVGPVFLRGIKKSQVIEVKAIAPPGLKILHAEKIYAHISVEEEEIDRWIRNIPIVCDGQNHKKYDYQIIPSFADILIRGKVSEVETVISGKEPIHQPVESLPPRSEPYSYKLWYWTSLVRIKKIQPGSVKIYISKKKNIVPLIKPEKKQINVPTSEQPADETPETPTVGKVQSE